MNSAAGLTTLVSVASTIANTTEGSCPSRRSRCWQQDRLCSLQHGVRKCLVQRVEQYLPPHPDPRLPYPQQYFSLKMGPLSLPLTPSHVPSSRAAASLSLETTPPLSSSPAHRHRPCHSRSLRLPTTFIPPARSTPPICKST